MTHTETRELLELAAKAVGIELDVRSEEEFCTRTKDDAMWNPLTDDGDALRLAVKLRFSVCNSPVIGASWICDRFGKNIAEVLHDDAVGYDPYVATRLAIVRAAAEIGRAM